MAQTSLWLAASEGNIDNIREALEAGAKINGPPGDKNAPLGAAIMGDHVDAAAVLLAAGADVNALCLGNTPAFELAVYQKNPNMIRLLLTRANQRVDVSLKPDQTPDSFAPPLLRMLDIDDPELLELFLSRADGIDLDAVDAVGRSAFEIAANKPALLDVLLRYRDQRR
jgi:ankyrin repeat protein